MKIQNNELREQSIKFDEKLDEMKNEIKEQNDNFDKHFEELNMKMNKVDDNSKSREIDKVDTVSYTHLDVYKRQVQWIL